MLFVLVQSYLHGAWSRPLFFEWSPWIAMHGYDWHISLMVDRNSMVYMLLLALVYPAIVRFSFPFFYREPGEQRYFFLMTLFACALLITILAGNIDILYLGWELVGVASVMLIGFFRAYPRSAHGSLRALSYYRISDLGVLGAAIWMHHMFPHPDFMYLHDEATLASATAVAFLLVLGSMAKAAQWPTTSWLASAMEGPASSSAIFYGALSVHLGPFLLLRTEPLWMPHSDVRWTIAAVGIMTAIMAGWIGLTRTDAKTSLAYATATQLGLIYVEIALDWHNVALFHAFVHASLRTWQFLRSSSLIADFQDNPVARDAILAGTKSRWETWIPELLRQRLYFLSLREMHLDAWMAALFVKPMANMVHQLHRLRMTRKTISWVMTDVILVLGVCVVSAQNQRSVAPHWNWLPLLLTGMGLLHAWMGLGSNLARHSVLHVMASQCYLATAGWVLGQEGHVGARLMALSVLVSGAVMAIVFSHIQEQPIRTFQNDFSMALGLGLAPKLPALHAAFVIVAWLMVGVPGGIAFFAEDLLFHAFTEHSLPVTVGFLFAMGINAIAMYRAYLHLFTGRYDLAAMHVTITHPRMRTRSTLALLVLVMMGVGIYPQLLLG